MSTAPSPTLEKLARALPEDERKDLYRRITRSLSLENREDKRVYHPEVDPERRREMINSDMANLSLGERLRVWLRKVLTAKPSDEAFIDIRLADLRWRIEHAQHPMTPGSVDRVSPEVAEAVYRLYYTVRPVGPTLRRIWASEASVRSLVSETLRRAVPNSKSTLEDFISFREMQDLYLNTENRSDLRKEVLRRLESYIEGIHESVFEHARQGLLPLYYLRDLVQFDYAGFLAYFLPNAEPPMLEEPGSAPASDNDTGEPGNYGDWESSGTYGDYGEKGAPEDTQSSDGGETSDGTQIPEFDYATASACIDDLEGLYGAIHLAARRGTARRDVFESWLRLVKHTQATEARETAESQEAGETAERPSSRPDGDADTPPEAGEGEGEDEDVAEEARRLTNTFSDVQEAVQDFKETLPWAELVRYHRGDPYHRIILYTPRLRLKQFYRNHLKMKLLQELDESIPRVRHGVVDQMVHSLFDGEPADLRHYQRMPDDNLRKMGLPGLRYVRTLNIAYRMVASVYQRRYQDLVRLLIRIMPPQKKDAGDELQAHASGLEELAPRIEEFDASFAPDADDGKLFHRVRQASSIDRSQQRAYRVMMGQKETEARDMAREVRDHFNGIREQFQDLLQTSSEALKERYKAFDPKRARSSAMEASLQERVVELANFRVLMNQVMVIEEAS